MPGDFNHDKGLAQLVFGMGRKHLLEFLVYPVHSRGRNPQVDDPGAEIADEDQAPEIPISRHEDPCLSLGEREQIRIGGLGQPRFRGCDNVVPQPPEQPCCYRINVLVEKEFHWPDVTCRSSAPRTSMA